MVAAGESRGNSLRELDGMLSSDDRVILLGAPGIGKSS